jgi:hypothetical protein
MILIAGLPSDACGDTPVLGPPPPPPPPMRHLTKRPRTKCGIDVLEEFDQQYKLDPALAAG